MSGLYDELKRRNVIRVCLAYLVGAWLLLQVVDVIGPILDLPETLAKYLLFLLVIGLIPAAVLAWVYEWTADGVRRENAHAAGSIEPRGRRLDRIIMVTLALAVAFLLFDKLALQNDPPATPVTEAAEPPAPGGPGEQAVTAQHIEKSVAVLPFTAMSNGPDDDFFADGLSQEIINSLSQLPQLRVTARSSAFHFKSQNLPLAEVGEKLGVANIVEGSVRRAGDRLRISAQLIRAEDSFTLWSESYDRNSGDTLAIQADIAEQVATALNVVLDDRLRAHMQRAGTRNAGAFIELQKGILLFERAHRELNQVSLLRQANAHFEEARRQETGLVEAYQYHSDLSSHVLLSRAAGELEGDITEADLARAPQEIESDYRLSIRHARNRSQRYNAELGLALLTGRWQGIRAASNRALTSNSCESPLWAHTIGAAFGDAGNVLASFQRMAACDPLRVRPRVHSVGALLWLQQPERAGQLARRSLEQFNHPFLVRGLAQALAAQGRHDEALNAANSRAGSSPDLWLTRSLLASMRGDKEAAADARNQFLLSNGPNDGDSLLLEAAMGNRSEANRLASLVDGRPFGYMVLLQSIYECMCGAPFDLEATPAFSAMLAESGLEWPPENALNFPLKHW